MKKMLVMFIVTLVMFAWVETSDGAVVVGESNPLYIIGFNDGNSMSIEMSSDARLMEDILGVESAVTSGSGRYYIYLGKKDAGATVFAGYLSVDQNGWASGNIWTSLLPKGSRAEVLLVLYDPSGGRFGEVEEEDGSEELIFDSDVLVWESGGIPGLSWAGDIWYNDVLDGFLDHVFVEYNSSFFEDLGNIVLVVPEPATILLMGIGFPFCVRRRKRRIAHVS